MVDDGEGSPLAPDDIESPQQQLDMWRGVITSQYTIHGEPVKVTTVAHPERDLVAAHIESPLAAAGRLRVKLSFPRGYDTSVKNTPGFDWSQPASHSSRIVSSNAGGARISRAIDDSHYEVDVHWDGPGAGAERLRETGLHEFALAPARGSSVLSREKHWDHVIAHLPPIAENDGLYVALESHPDTWENVDSRHDHPTMLAPLGLLPGGRVDREKMNNTLDAVLARWDWETKIWGWDYPMIAMTAARLGRPEDAVDILVRNGPNNAYLKNGHVPQRSAAASGFRPR